MDTTMGMGTTTGMDMGMVIKEEKTKFYVRCFAEWIDWAKLQTCKRNRKCVLCPVLFFQFID